MRVVMRVLFFEFALSWALLLAGWIRVAVQIWPFVMGTLKAGFRGRAWRVGLGLLVGLPVVAGWPVLLWPVQAEYMHGDWLKMAIPWWVLIGAVGSLLLATKVSEVGSRTERGTGCRCGTCVAYGLTMNTYTHVLPDIERTAVDAAAETICG
ncbi:MAG: hypothetical protein ACM3ML_20245 [Micromonosporaceae bacterium]